MTPPESVAELGIVATRHTNGGEMDADWNYAASSLSARLDDLPMQFPHIGHLMQRPINVVNWFRHDDMVDNRPWQVWLATAWTHPAALGAALGRLN